MDWQSPAFWAEFLHAIAYREGLGDALAEGGWAAAQRARPGREIAARRYPGWGHAGHWDGRDGGVLTVSRTGGARAAVDVRHARPL